VEVFVVLIAAFGIYYYVKSRSARNEASEWAAMIQRRQADAETRIELWEKQGGGVPTVGVWQAIARMHVMVVVAPKRYKSIIPPAPPETRARLDQIYKKSGVSLKAQDMIPDWLWDDANTGFAESYRLTYFQVGELASMRGWRP
jgi:hypothetical protein